MGFSAAPDLSEPAELARQPLLGEVAVPRPTLPPELACLRDQLSPAILDAAARMAEVVGTTAEAVLLGEGLISTDRYYRALSVFLGLPFAERPCRPAAASETGDALEAGIVRLDSNTSGWQFLAAPRGPALRRFIDMMSAKSARRGFVAITSPERLEALLRHDRRRDVMKVASHGLADWDRTLSARSGPTPGQILAMLGFAVCFCLAAWAEPEMSLLAIEMAFAVGFLLAVALRLAATAASRRPTRRSSDPRMKAADLPVYTVIVPLFREAKVVRRLIAALNRLDYPRAKLDIILAVEMNDTATLDTIERLQLPARYRTVVAPNGRPRTKPRALNVALQFARGDFVVVYDAEDEPEPDQLRAAVQAFGDDPDVACLQARLAVDNHGDSWLAALFAVEYAALFHVINPGLAALGLPIPLGGTSNHFRIEALRRVNGWDAWNVTEDIDLGIRFARFGLRVGSLESDTFEEAPHTLGAWLKQRCRWLKGWVVTLVTHSRAPVRLLRELGPISTLAVVAMLFGTVASCLLGPFCVALLLVRASTGGLFWARTSFEAWWNAISVALLALGALSLLWPAIAGLRRRGLARLIGWLPFYPAYLLLLSVAAWQAAGEAFGRPHAWAKTEHGKAKRRLGSTLTS